MSSLASPTLGIMTLYSGKGTLDAEERVFFRSLVLQGMEIGLDVFVFTPEDASTDGHRVHAHVYDRSRSLWKREWRKWPDAVYDRCRAQRSPKFGQMRRFRARYPKLRYLNHPLSSKWGNHLVLQKHNGIRPHLPQTQIYRNVQDLIEFSAKYPLVYVKPVDGSGGRGIARFARAEDGRLAMSGRSPSRKIIAPVRGTPASLMGKWSSWRIGRRYLIQQGIPIELKGGRVHDFRLLIQKNDRGSWQVTGIAGRVGGSGSATSNLHGGGEAVAFEKLLARRGWREGKIEAIRSDMERLALNTAAVLERRFGRLCELALDLAVDPQGHVWLLEVNPKPSREVFKRIGDRASYHLALRRPLEYALHLAEQNRS
ncbi:YheC/YheD family endospore coat-associated protein [Gorillibacterium timonense]|uniref:YheC/YheD family endospore coat-associated protein n=1 Tax=Gorillibacterium timonense TaxID=1689269 RepID=UPI0009EA69A6|nr:YheC/YheD family protein [Gorillibacterium timonense]